MIMRVRPQQAQSFLFSASRIHKWEVYFEFRLQ